MDWLSHTLRFVEPMLLDLRGRFRLKRMMAVENVKNLHTALIDSRAAYELALKDTEDEDVAGICREMISLRHSDHLDREKTPVVKIMKLTKRSAPLNAHVTPSRRPWVNASFAPDLIKVMQRALEGAISTLPHPVSSSHIKSIAETILRSASEGERNPTKIA